MSSTPGSAPSKRPRPIDFGASCATPRAASIGLSMQSAGALMSRKSWKH
ncbi:hypothetical protein [Sphingomonas sp. SRS2]|nr:hypothetical protein [Sphingomonas sp. SRS2]